MPKPIRVREPDPERASTTDSITASDSTPVTRRGRWRKPKTLPPSSSIHFYPRGVYPDLSRPLLTPDGVPGRAKLKEFANLPAAIERRLPTLRCDDAAKIRKREVWLRELQNQDVDLYRVDRDGLRVDCDPDDLKYRDVMALVRIHGMDPDDYPEWVDYDRDVRCLNDAIAGVTKCLYHGGNNPSARQDAERRIFGLVEPAIEVVEMAISAGSKGVDRTQLRAAMNLLDRAGLKAPTEINVNRGWEFGDLSKLSEEELTMLLGLIQKAQEAQLDQDAQEAEFEEVGSEA